MINFARRQTLLISWLIALIALLTSLYLSEALEWPVCELCWYQRVFLYPQVILLGMAVFNEDRNVLRYTLALSAIGLLFAIYHYLEQLFPLTFQGIITCSVGVNCATRHINWLGFITLPLLSVCTFATLLIVQTIGRSNRFDDLGR